MKSEPRVGHAFQRRFTVGPNHLISFADDQMPAVLSTPALIAEMEYTARDSVADLLDANERTVGVAVDVEHLAVGIPGSEVTCASRVLGFERGVVTFQVEARDGAGLLSRGVHRRRVVDVGLIRRRFERKKGLANPSS